MPEKDKQSCIPEKDTIALPSIWEIMFSHRSLTVCSDSELHESYTPTPNIQQWVDAIKAHIRAARDSPLACSQSAYLSSGLNLTEMTPPPDLGSPSSFVESTAQLLEHPNAASLGQSENAAVLTVNMERGLGGESDEASNATTPISTNTRSVTISERLSYQPDNLIGIGGSVRVGIFSGIWLGLGKPVHFSLVWSLLGAPFSCSHQWPPSTLFALHCTQSENTQLLNESSARPNCKPIFCIIKR